MFLLCYLFQDEVEVVEEVVEGQEGQVVPQEHHQVAPLDRHHKVVLVLKSHQTMPTLQTILQLPMASHQLLPMQPNLHRQRNSLNSRSSRSNSQPLPSLNRLLNNSPQLPNRLMLSQHNRSLQLLNSNNRPNLNLHRTNSLLHNKPNLLLREGQSLHRLLISLLHKAKPNLQVLNKVLPNLHSRELLNQLARQPSLQHRVQPNQLVNLQPNKVKQLPNLADKQLLNQLKVRPNQVPLRLLPMRNKGNKNKVSRSNRANKVNKVNKAKDNKEIQWYV